MSSSRPQATPTVQIDNDLCIVTLWHFEPGAQTGWHTHEYDYVVVPTTNGELLLETEQGPITAQLTLGQSYTRQAGVKHNVVNAGSEPMAFVEIEWRATQRK